MMNQAASATRRPAGSAATAGCCPMFNAPFFVNSPFAHQAPLIPPPNATQQCFLGSQATTRLDIPPTQPPQQHQQTAVQPQSVSRQPSGPIEDSGQHQQQVLQPQPVPQQAQQRIQEQPNTYSTSFTAPALSFPHLISSRHSASDCVALAAAIASAASFPHIQQLQQQAQQQQLHQTPINQASQNISTTVNAANLVPPTSVTNTSSATNQVPILNFNSYNAAQPFLNLLPTPAAAPPPSTTAHLNTASNNNGTTNVAPTNQPTVVQTTQLTNTGSHQSHHRPLATNTTLNNAANQQQVNYRNASVAPSQQPTQHLGQIPIDRINQLLNDQLQAVLLNQLFANQQLVQPLNVQPPQSQQQQPTSAPVNRTRSPQQQTQAGPTQTVIPTAQPGAPIVPQQTQELVSGQSQPQQAQSFQTQPTVQARLPQVPISDHYASSGAAATTNGLYQQPQQQQHTSSVGQHHPSSESVPQTQQQASQPSQQPQTVPHLPFYSFPHMEQAIALLTNPQVANNIFSHVFTYLQSANLRTEPHHTLHHHHPPHHFHHHLHGSHHHHHHHHGPNGQGAGQDVTMPLDSLAISESKPRGLNRAEIDSLTPYLHTNEKDTSSCVICLSKFELKSKIRPLPCNHVFHAKCVDKWLRANRTCPICRRDALKTYGAKIKRI